MKLTFVNNIQRGHTVVQLVEALRYKLEGRGFDSRWWSLEFFIDVIGSGRIMVLGLNQPLTEISIARAERDGTRAETRFRLSPKRTSPFKSVGASVQSTAGSRGVRISLSNAG